MARVMWWAAVGLALALPNIVQARWWHHHRAVQVAAYYYAVPVVYAPVVPTAVPVIPYLPPATPTLTPSAPVYAVPPITPPPPVPGYAQPSTAPPSSAPAPYPPPPSSGGGASGPVRSQGLKPNTTTDNYFESYSIAPKENAPAVSPDRQPVWFWNMSGHDMTLCVAGQSQNLAAGKRVNLKLARNFVWQLDGREPQVSSLPENGAGLDIIIRR